MPDAVVPLMYESWEFRETDLDLAACRQRGIRVTGTNERHPEVDVFSFLGIMAVKLLLDAGVSVYRSRVLLLCGNPFEPFITAGLEAAGATVVVASSPAEAELASCDAVVVARQPSASQALDDDELKAIYHRKVQETHPDKLTAMGLPPEFVQLANDKIARINDAYDRICQQRQTSTASAPKWYHGG